MYTKALIISVVFLASTIPFGGFAQQKKQKPSAHSQAVRQANVPPDAIDSAMIKYHLAPLSPMSPIPNPMLPLHSVDGKTVTLHDAQKKNGLLVMFSCVTCPFVHKAEVHTKEIMEYTQQKGIGMVIINSNEGTRGSDDSPEAMGEYAHRKQYTVPYLIDDRSVTANLFGATHTPEVFLFNGQGNLVYRGAMEDNPGDPQHSTHFYLKEAIDSMLVNRPYMPAVTRSIGCSIKRTE